MKKWIRAISYAIVLGVAAQPAALAAGESPGDGGTCCYDLRRCQQACVNQRNNCPTPTPYTEAQCDQAEAICQQLCFRDWP
jgi:hypothetical protein